MSVREKIQIPFGSDVRRFNSIGFHPKFEVRLGTRKYSNIFPGCYHKENNRKIVSKIASWKTCLAAEEFSRRLGYRNEKILENRIWNKSINGPGWQDVSTGPYAKEFTFPKRVRFPQAKFKSFAVPGPGTYGKNHVPYTRYEEKSHEKGFSFSILPPFERSLGRPTGLSDDKPYKLPPNIYHLKTSIEELLLKRISKRGPYDLFTGPRFGKTVTQKRIDKKMITAQRIDPNNWNHPKNSFKGKFLRCGKDSIITSRMVIKGSMNEQNSCTPGPSHYNPFPTAVIFPSMTPFNSSTYVRTPERVGLLPPPGRYNPDRKKRIIGDGMKSVFISQTKRALPGPSKYSWFE